MSKKDTGPRRRVRIELPAASSIDLNTGLGGSPGKKSEPLPGPGWILLD
jgi:hypothetical protein